MTSSSECCSPKSSILINGKESCSLANVEEITLSFPYFGSLNNLLKPYPYSLKLAHNNCKISGKDLSKLVSLHGLSSEIGSREVLG